MIYYDQKNVKTASDRPPISARPKFFLLAPCKKQDLPGATGTYRDLKNIKTTFAIGNRKTPSPSVFSIQKVFAAAQRPHHGPGWCLTPGAPLIGWPLDFGGYTTKAT